MASSLAEEILSLVLKRLYKFCISTEGGIIEGIIRNKRDDNLIYDNYY